jgi:hypothetical protein
MPLCRSAPRSGAGIIAKGAKEAHPWLIFLHPFGVLFLCVLFLGACGKVGDPKPPFIRIPERVKDLGVTQSGYSLILAWTNPPRYIDGSEATNLARAQIRANGSALTTLNINGAGKPQSYAISLAPELGGERTFTVIVETSQGKLSEVSNAASVTPVPVPGRIPVLEATADQRRIFLQWQKPLDHPELADAYIVVRTDIPAEPETVTDTRYEDIRYQAGKTLTYQVTPLRRVSGTTVLGVGPEMTTILAQDKTPPAVPHGFEITPLDTGAFVAWEPNDETDLAGYQVYRSEKPTEGFKPVGDRVITNNGFSDPSYRPGLYYRVSAVDEFGNESAMSAPFHGP